MTQIDIISGFLGAGKTTLIKKLLSEALPGAEECAHRERVRRDRHRRRLFEGRRGGDYRDELRLHLLLPGGRLRRRPEKGAGGLLPRPHHHRALRSRKTVRRDRRRGAGAEGVPGASAPQLRHRGGRHQGPDLHEELRASSSTTRWNTPPPFSSPAPRAWTRAS